MRMSLSSRSTLTRTATAAVGAAIALTAVLGASSTGSTEGFRSVKGGASLHLIGVDGASLHKIDQNGASLH